MGTEAGYEDVMNLQKTKTMKETDRKCPQCGGVMDYDPALSKLHCPYCDETGIPQPFLIFYAPLRVLTPF